MTELMRAHYEWASRPDDQRFNDLDSLYADAYRDRYASRENKFNLRSLQVKVDPERNDLYVSSTEMERGEFTNYGFGKLCTLTGAPAAYLRTLPPTFAGACLQYGIEGAYDVLSNMMVTDTAEGETQVRTFTSQSYGRIWDEEIVGKVIEMNADGRWQVPSASYSGTDPKRATTLYRGDRSMFIFLVDPEKPIETRGEVLHRGFIVSNSEVGNGTLTITMFLYRVVCDNRIIWGAENITEFSMRHSKYAPQRFITEAAPKLAAYADAGTAGITKTVSEAKKLKVGSNIQEVEEWLQKRGFTKTIAKAAVNKASEEEGDPKTLWNVVQGVTAYARGIGYADTRVDLERSAGKLLELVGA